MIQRTIMQPDQTVHRIKNLTTAEHSHRSCITKIDCAADAAEFKETSQIYM